MKTSKLAKIMHVINMLEGKDSFILIDTKNQCIQFWHGTSEEEAIHHIDIELDGDDWEDRLNEWQDYVSLNMYR